MSKTSKVDAEKIAVLDELIRLQARKLDTLIGLKKDALSGKIVSFEDYLLSGYLDGPNVALDSAISESVLTPLTTITTNYTIVDCRVLTQVISPRFSKNVGDAFSQFVASIDAHGTLYLYSDRGLLLLTYKLPIWSAISTISYHGASSSHPFLFVGFQDGSNVIIAFDIYANGDFVAGLHPPQQGKKKRAGGMSKEPAGIFGYITMPIRTPQARVVSGGSSSASAKRSIAYSHMVYNVTVKPLTILRFATNLDDPSSTSISDATFSVEVFKSSLNAFELVPSVVKPKTKPTAAGPACSSSERRNGQCPSSSSGSKGSQGPLFTTAVYPFFDINKKAMRLFIGDSRGNFYSTDVRGTVLGYSHLAPGVPITSIARSSQTMAVAADKTIYFLQFTKFLFSPQRCSTPHPVVHIEFDIQHPLQLVALMTTGDAIVFNTRVASGKRADPLECAVLATFPHDGGTLASLSSAAANVGLSTGSGSSKQGGTPAIPYKFGSLSAAAKKKFGAALVAPPLDLPHHRWQQHMMLQPDARAGMVAVLKGYYLFTSGCQLFAFNTSLSDKDYMEIDPLDTSSLRLCDDFIPHPSLFPANANASAVRLFSKPFIDTSVGLHRLRGSRRLPRAALVVGGHPLTVVAYNTPSNATATAGAEIRLFGTQLTFTEIDVQPPMWSVLTKTPLIWLVAAGFIFFNIWRVLSKSNAETNKHMKSLSSSQRKHPGRRHAGTDDVDGRDDPDAFYSSMGRNGPKDDSGDHGLFGGDAGAEEFAKKMRELRSSNPAEARRVEAALEDLQRRRHQRGDE